MAHREEILEIEAELAARGMSVAAFCRAAELSQTSWVRWKNGSSATTRVWARIQETRVRLLGAAVTVAG